MFPIFSYIFRNLIIALKVYFFYLLHFNMFVYICHFVYILFDAEVCALQDILGAKVATLEADLATLSKAVADSQSNAPSSRCARADPEPERAAELRLGTTQNGVLPRSGGSRGYPELDQTPVFRVAPTRSHKSRCRFE